jgi:translocator assembly and maintenance protein 41
MSIDGKVTSQCELHEILESFPGSISHGFGYGSGVFAQTKSDVMSSTLKDDLPMIDLIFSTSNPIGWHKDNLSKNYDHYALLPRILGPYLISTIQESGAGVYFNPMVQVGKKRKRLVKYGVIRDDVLKRDLKEWNSMYIAGRMHKPTHPLVASDEITMLQEKYNLKYALSTSLLLISEQQELQDSYRRAEYHSHSNVELGEIFEAISGLSYTGDPRVTAGAEDPRKIQKLVHSTGQLDRFRMLYEDQLGELERKGLLTLQNDAVEINLFDTSTRKVLHGRLPPNLQRDTAYLISGINDDEETLLNAVQMSKVLTKSLEKIVGPSSKVQSVKGLLTAGVFKSVKYAAAKFSKGALKGIL